MTVDKRMHMPVKTEMYDEAGRLWKSAEQAYASIDGYWVMTAVKMTDHKKGSSTTLEFKDMKVDKGVGADLFTERSLVRKIQG